MLHKKLGKLTLTKHAAAMTQLSDNSATYGNEIIAALYKQHNYLGKYQVDLEVKGQDDRQGYMYGVFVVSPPAEAQPPQVPEGGQVPPLQPDPATVIRIPVIVASRKVYPFDTMINADGKFYPLSEQRVAAAMFQASPYTVAAPNPAATNQAMGDMAPVDGAPAAVQAGRFAKMSSVLAYASLAEDDVNALLARVQGDAELAHAVALRSGFAQALDTIVSAQGTTKTASAHEPVRAPVVLLERRPGGACVGSAIGTDGRTVRTFYLDRHDTTGLDLDVRQPLISDGYVVLSEEKTAGLSASPTANAQEVTTTGAYAVMTSAGESMRAAVIAGPVSLVTGEATDGLVVLSKYGASSMHKLAGVRCGDLDLSAPRGALPRGQGVFVFNGRCTEVVKVAHIVNHNGNVRYEVEDALLGPVQLHVADVVNLTRAADREYLLPRDHAFVPVQAANVPLQASPNLMVKISSRTAFRDEMRLAEAASGRLSFTGGGHSPTAEYNDPVSAALLVLHGDTDRGAKEKVAAAHKRPVTFVATTRLARDSVKVASAPAQDVSHIREDLVKEAAAIQQQQPATTVDAVLSLGFITPENVQNYIDALPVLDEAASKLAELLIGVRLGLSDVQETAVSGAMSGMDRSIAGLKQLQLRTGAEATQ